MNGYNRRRFISDAGMAGMAMGLTTWSSPAVASTTMTSVATSCTISSVTCADVSPVKSASVSQAVMVNKIKIIGIIYIIILIQKHLYYIL